MGWLGATKVNSCWGILCKIGVDFHFVRNFPAWIPRIPHNNSKAWMYFQKKVVEFFIKSGQILILCLVWILSEFYSVILKFRSLIVGWAKSYFTRAPSNGFSPENFFAVSSENFDFPKKLLNMKIFIIKFVIKKVILISGVRWLLLLKNAYIPQNFLAHVN